MNVLIVDDQADVVQGMVGGVHWESCGIDGVYTAGSATEARSVITNHIIHIILCDIEMPGENGLELMAWVHANYPETVCICLTCHADFSYAQQAIRLECMAYILQPAPYEEIEDNIRAAIGRFRERTLASPVRPEPQVQEEPPIERVKAYIRRHLHQNITRSELASHVWLNEDYLSRLFKKETGKKLSDYILDERIGQAKSLLARTDLSISVIALKCGFNDSTYFSYVFKKQTAMTPVDFRKISKHGSGYEEK